MYYHYNIHSPLLSNKNTEFLQIFSNKFREFFLYIIKKCINYYFLHKRFLNSQKKWKIVMPFLPPLRAPKEACKPLSRPVCSRKKSQICIWRVFIHSIKACRRPRCLRGESSGGRTVQGAAGSHICAFALLTLPDLRKRLVLQFTRAHYCICATCERSPPRAAPKKHPHGVLFWCRWSGSNRHELAFEGF